MLTSLLLNTETGKDMWLVNMTPYDAHIEMALLKWSLEEDRKWKSLSVSTDLTLVEYSQRTVGLQLFEDIQLGWPCVCA